MKKIIANPNPNPNPFSLEKVKRKKQDFKYQSGLILLYLMIHVSRMLYQEITLIYPTRVYIINKLTRV